MAAPKKPAKDRKVHSLPSVRCTQEEYRHIEAKAKRAGMTVSRYVRETALRHKVVSRETEQEDTAVAYFLQRIGNNLNQLTRALHTTGEMPKRLPDLLDRLSDYLDQNIYRNDRTC